MSVIFIIISVFSITVLIFINPDAALSSMLAGTEGAIRLAVSLCAIYAVWLSLLKLMQDAGLSPKIARFMRPVMKKLFPGESDAAYEALTMNMSANLLGMGGAATPMGIRTVEEMWDKKSDRATHNMCLFIVINCTSIQLLPGTIIALRAASGSVSASDIIVPSLISTTVSTLTGVLLCYALRRFDNRRAK